MGSDPGRELLDGASALPRLAGVVVPDCSCRNLGSLDAALRRGALRRLDQGAQAGPSRRDQPSKQGCRSSKNVFHSEPKLY